VKRDFNGKDRSRITYWKRFLSLDVLLFVLVSIRKKKKSLKLRELVLVRSRLKPEFSHIKQLLSYTSGIFHC